MARRFGRIRLAFRALRSGAGYVAGQNARWSRNWKTSSGSPDGELLLDIQRIRERSRDLYKNNDIAGGLLDLITGHVIGRGLRMQTAMDREVIAEHLGIGEEESTEFFDKLELQIERSFNTWAESLESDFHGEATFYENQVLAFLSVLQSGEVFVTTPLVQHHNAPYRLRVGLIEADQVQSPLGIASSRANRDGVETTAEGTPIAYWVNRNQESDPQEPQRIPKFGLKSGRQLIHHLFQRKRPGQTRGVPLIARMMQSLHKINKYTQSELTAAEVASWFTAFITSESGEGLNGIVDEDNPQTDASKQREGEDIALGAGAIIDLRPGEEVKLADPTRPNANYGGFIESQLKLVGMGSGVPFEILVRMFTSSFSASRAARIEMQKLVNAYRSWFNTRMNQPMYEEFFIEEVLAGRIEAPGFFDSFEVMRAYLGTIWAGEAMGLIDPQKEVEAAHQTVKKQFSTMTQMTAQLTGLNYEQVLKVQAREKRLREKLGLESELDETTENDIDKTVNNMIDKKVEEKTEELNGKTA